ncbi:MAG: pyruvate kinase [Ignavibacteriaceae bacterium]|jgi:pyruvate kinase|nr:pyruvate kinase [Ignavibacteriaceae bacterium]
MKEKIKSPYEEIVEHFARTKILATLGPGTSSREMIGKLMEAGVDGVRLNFSHGNFEFFEKLFTEIKRGREIERYPLSVLVDLQGPKIRVGELSEPEIELKEGKTVEITTDQIKGTANRISTSYKWLSRDAKINDLILIDDGLLRLRVVKKKKKSVIGLVENGGILKPRKGMNLPGMDLSTPALTQADIRNLNFALKFDVNFIALSFVRNEKDILQLKEWLRLKKKNKPVIAKIEKKEAVDNFSEILKYADGIMVARGDLGVEMETHQVPIVQKQIIRECNVVGKPVITATQMLESMVNNPIPTRAEASDVANAVWDGTDVVMLSAETSVGKYPIQAVKVMNNIIRGAERVGSKSTPVEYHIPSGRNENLFDSYCKAIVSISKQTGAKAIVVFTHKGRTAERISKYRPTARIIALSDSVETMNSLSLKWGILPVFCETINHQEKAISEAKRLVVETGNGKKGDIIVVTSGAPITDQNRINWMKYVVV